MAATDLERLVVQLSADTKKFENAMNRMMGVTNKQMRGIEARTAKMSSNLNRSFQDSLRGAVALAGTAIGFQEIQQYADAWTEAGNKIAAAAKSSGVQARSLGELRQGADDARVSLGDYVDLYAKLIRSASGVAKSEQEIATATTIVSKAFKAGGAGAQEQAAGILQLGQALGSGVLQGDELRSLRENAPLIAQAIATEFKTTIAGLKQLGADGKLTSDRVFKAILAAQRPIEAQFNATNATIADGFTRLKNSVTEYIGTTAEAYGVTQTINGVLAAMAGNIGSVANAAAAAAVILAASFGRGAAIAGVAALANPFVLLAAAVGTAAFAITALWDDIVPLQGSFATLGDYATALWDAMSAGAEATNQAVVAAFDTIVSSINTALSGVGTSIEGVWNAVKTGINAIINSFKTLSDVVVATFETVPAAIGDAVLSAMNAMVSGVETGINKVISAVNTAIGAINSLGEFAGVAAIPTIDPVSLGRLENEYAGAGKRASKAFQDAVNRPSVDYVGAAGAAIVGSVDNATAAIVARANEIAAARQELERETGRGNAFSGLGDNTAGFGTAKPVAGSGSGSGSKGGKKKQSEYAREVEQIRERTAALQAETAAQATVNPLVDDYGYAMEKARTEHDLLAAAQEAGLAITPQLKTSIAQLAEGYAQASVEAQKLQESQEGVRQAAEDFKQTGKDVASGFINDLRQGKSMAEALAGALNKVVDKLIDVALNAAFGLGGGGMGGGLLAGIGALFGFANGGYTGNGGKYEPAGIVHKGEYVFDAQATKKLGAKNLAKLAGYANGGMVGSAPRMPAMPSSSQRDSGVHVTVGVSADNNGNLMPFVESVSERKVAAAAPKIVSASQQRVMPTIANYQQSRAGGDYRG